MPKTQDRLSLDDLLIPVTVLIPTGANPDTSIDIVQFQFVPGGLPPRARPNPDAWIPGFWETNTPGPLLAGILVGPGGTVELAPGRWAVWVTVLDNPTVPVQAVDQILIT